MVTMFKSARIFRFPLAYSGLSVRIFGFLICRDKFRNKFSHILFSTARIFRFYCAYSVLFCKNYAHIRVSLAYSVFPIHFFRIFRFQLLAYSFWLVALTFSNRMIAFIMFYSVIRVFLFLIILSLNQY